MRLKLEDKTSRIKVGMKRKSACPPARSAAEADCAPSIESRSNHVDNYRAITFYSLLLCVSLFSFNLILSIFLPPLPLSILSDSPSGMDPEWEKKDGRRFQQRDPNDKRTETERTNTNRRLSFLFLSLKFSILLLLLLPFLPALLPSLRSGS